MATTNVADRLVCITQAAFAEIGDGWGLAEGAMGMPPYMGVVSGLDERRGDRPYVNQMFLGSGGGPGSPTADGWPTYLIPVCASLVYKDSVEIDEQRYPIHVYEQILLPDTEGAGRQRGGFGCRTVYGPKQRPMMVAWSVEAHENPPRGVRGGLSAQPADAWMLTASDERQPVDPVGAVELQPGEKIVSITAGGGGYGDPRTRAIAAVVHDVREGWISQERARSVYGVALTKAPDGELRVDEKATELERKGVAA